jgi:hypothetical protein
MRGWSWKAEPDLASAGRAQVKGENTDVNVKRLPKRPMPPRFGRKLTAAQRENATHICVDCGCAGILKTPLQLESPSSSAAGRAVTGPCATPHGLRVHATITWEAFSGSTACPHDTAWLGRSAGQCCGLFTNAGSA